MRKVILLISVIAVIAAGWFFYFSGGNEKPSVSVVTAKYRDLSDSLEFSGEVVPRKMYSVMSPVGGQIKEIYVSEGNTVNKGDLLISFDTSQLDIELEKAQLSYDLLEDAQAQTVMSGGGFNSVMAQEKAKVALALSQTTGYDYESFNETFGIDISDEAAAMASSLEGMQLSDISDFDFSEMPIGASSELEMARLAVKGLEAAISKMTIVSELTGSVIMLNVNAGEVLAPGMPAMVIADTENTVIKAYVYENDIGQLSEGMKVRIISDPKRYIGALTKIGAAAAGVGQTSVFDTMTKVEIEPEERFDRMPGAIVDLEIIISSKEDVLSLPMNCITDDNCVYVVDEEGLVHKRDVVTGFTDTYYVQIISGVEPNEMVVVSPKNLSEGQSVDYDTSE